MHPCNPYVSQQTRAWLSVLADRGDVIDIPSVSLLWPALRACHAKHPGGFCYEMALAMGTEQSVAASVASACEIFYTACSLSDDIQDGDASAYLPERLSLQINAQGHLLALIAERIATLPIASGHADRWVTEAYHILAQMVMGQHREIVRCPWTVQDYARVARLSAGTQMGLYVGLVGWASGAHPHQIAAMRAWGGCFGACLQVVWDHYEMDDRLLGLDASDMTKMTKEMVLTLQATLDSLPGALRSVVERATRAVCQDALG